MTDLRLSPHKATPVNGSTEAWWYESAASISVYITGPDGRTACCEIQRRWLAQWLAKTLNAAGSRLLLPVHARKMRHAERSIRAGFVPFVPEGQQSRGEPGDAA